MISRACGNPEYRMCDKKPADLDLYFFRPTSGLPGAVYDVRLKLRFCLLNDGGCGPYTPAFLSWEGYFIICRPSCFDHFRFQYGGKL